MNKRLFVIMLCVACFISSFACLAEDVKSFFKTNTALPDITADNFIDGPRRPLFRWMSKTEKTGAHYPGYRNSPALNFLEFKVFDANFRFVDGKIKTIDVSLFNRGDAGTMDEKEFLTLLKDVENKISSWIGVKSKVGHKQRLPKNKGYIYTKIWVNKDLLVIMKWSLTNIRQSKVDKPEFLEINFAEFDPKKDPRKNITKHNVTKKNVVANIKNNIKINEDGDKYLDNIPMVDQGPKGYCAVAVTERVLRYYGQEINQHVMAELADSEASSGTNSEKMMEMLKKAGVKFRVKVKEHMTFSSRDFLREVDKYNKFRKRKKLPKIQRTTTLDGFFIQFKRDMDSYKEFKCKKLKNDLSKFKKTIIQSVDSGIPVVWGVILGMIPEKENPQAFGGHLRLIIGYNPKTNDIVFSDTWGAGHEFKKMNLDDAWTITTSYSNIYPRK